MSGPFKMKYSNSAFPFKSPLKDEGHGGKKGHGHTTLFGKKVQLVPSGKEILKSVKKGVKTVLSGKDPFPNISLYKKFKAKKGPY